MDRPVLKAKQQDYSEHMTNHSGIAHVISRVVLLHFKFNFTISAATAVAIVHNWSYLHPGEHYNHNSHFTITFHWNIFKEPCNAEPARTKVDKLRIITFQPSLRSVKFPTIPYKLWQDVPGREVHSSQLHGFGREAKPEFELRNILKLALEG